MKLTNRQAKQIRALKTMKDEGIDLGDIPEMSGDERMFLRYSHRGNRATAPIAFCSVLSGN